MYLDFWSFQVLEEKLKMDLDKSPWNTYRIKCRNANQHQFESRSGLFRSKPSQSLRSVVQRRISTKKHSQLVFFQEKRENLTGRLNYDLQWMRSV